MQDFISFVGQADLECVRVPASSAGPLHFEFQSKGGPRRLARVRRPQRGAGPVPGPRLLSRVSVRACFKLMLLRSLPPHPTPLVPRR